MRFHEVAVHGVSKPFLSFLFTSNMTDSSQSIKQLTHSATCLASLELVAAITILLCSFNLVGSVSLAIYYCFCA